MAQSAYATTAITALTAQNTRGVQDIKDVSPDFVVRQITSVLEDIGTDIVKTGMLSRRALIEHVAQTLADAGAPMIVDPVMVATSGDRLLDEDAVSALGDLWSIAFLVTPNLPNALGTRRDIDTPDDMKNAPPTRSWNAGAMPRSSGERGSEMSLLTAGTVIRL